MAQRGQAGGRFEVLGGSCLLHPPWEAAAVHGAFARGWWGAPKRPRSEHGARGNHNAAVGGTGWSFKFIVQKSESVIFKWTIKRAICSPVSRYPSNI